MAETYVDEQGQQRINLATLNSAIALMFKRMGARNMAHAVFLAYKWRVLD